MNTRSRKRTTHLTDIHRYIPLAWLPADTLKTALRRSLCPGRDRAAVCLDDASDDRQAQTGATRHACPSSIDPIKAIEDCLQVLLRDSSPVVLDGDEDADRALCYGQLHPASIAGYMLQRVDNQIQERLVESTTVADYLARPDDGETQVTIASVWQCSSLLVYVACDSAQVDRLVDKGARTLCIQTRQRQQIIHQSSKSTDLTAHRGCQMCCLRRVHLQRDRQQLELASKRGERRAELVGRIGNESTLGLKRILQPLCHVIEGAGKIANSIMADTYWDARRQVTTRHTMARDDHGGQRTEPKRRQPRTNHAASRQRQDPADQQERANRAEGAVDLLSDDRHLDVTQHWHARSAGLRRWTGTADRGRRWWWRRTDREQQHRQRPTGTVVEKACPAVGSARDGSQANWWRIRRLTFWASGTTDHLTAGV